MTAPTDTDDMNELVDAEFKRVDLVGKAANGTQFLILKARSEGRGLVEADLVRDLIAKSDAQEGNMTEPTPDAVAKAEETGTMADPAEIDLTEVLADPTGPTAAGSESDPGSPAWEQIDAATAMKWTAVAQRLKNALCLLSDRESLEDATGAAGDDWMNAADLSDAASAADFVISVLAPYAVSEQNEADTSTEEMAMVGKAMAGVDLDSLAMLEVLAPIVKAGKEISSANLAKINTAIESLQSVVAATNAAADVAKSKETEVSAPVGPDTAALAAADVAKAIGDMTDAGKAANQASTELADTINKAKGDPLTPVYDANGKLIAMVDSTDLIPIASPSGETTDPADATADAPPADDADLEPASPDATGAPADAPAPAAAPAPAPAAATAATTPSDEDTVAKATEDVFKSIADNVVKAALDEERTKRTADLAERDAVIKALDDRLTAWENKPAQSGVLSNGAMPPAHLLRGQNAGASPDFARGVELKKQLMESTDAAEQKRISDELQTLTVAAISKVHGR